MVKGKCILLLSYALISLVPVLPDTAIYRTPLGFQVLALVVIGWSALWAAFGSPRRFHWFLLPFFLLGPVEFYLKTHFSFGLSAHYLGVLSETSLLESVEFLGGQLLIFAAIALLMIAWWIYCGYLAIQAEGLAWRGYGRGIFLVAVLLCGIYLYPPDGLAKAAKITAEAFPASSIRLIAMTNPVVSEPEAKQPPHAEVASSLASASSPQTVQTRWFSEDAMLKTWPADLFIATTSFWNEREYLSSLKAKSVMFSFNASQTKGTDLPQIVVLVIGESARFDRWSINGYKRATSPELQNTKNLVSLRNVVTPVSATRLSVPIIVSRKPAMQSLTSGFTEKSLIEAYKEAGFKTYWLSNQMTFGKFDTPISVFAEEADIRQFLNTGGISSEFSHDGVLLESLRSITNDSSTKRKLIVLHTLGSHWNYSHRYPKAFDHWQPSLFGVQNPVYTDISIKEKLNNSYDNSILYTDWFLSQVIKTLDATSSSAAMFYIADHGQTLYDQSCNLAFHGHNTDYEFHISAFIWYSQAYSALHPSKVDALKTHTDRKLSTENVFHSMVDMVDIHFQGEDLSKSVFHASLRDHKRYVDSYGWSDYDNATVGGKCHEILERGRHVVARQ